MEYLRIDPDIDTDPGLEEAGWCAARVYELLLKVSAKYDLHGRIPPERQSAAWLARRWNLSASDLPGASPEDFISNGIARLLAVGKLVAEGDEWIIRGWDKAYAPKNPSTPRVQAHRARLRTPEPAPDETGRNVSCVSSRFGNGETPETPHHTTPPTPRNTTPQPTTAAAPRVVGGLRDGLDAIHQKHRGAPVTWTPELERALMPLVGRDEAEVLRRWDIALQTPFPRCLTVRELARHWDAYSAPPPSTTGPPKARDIRRGVARAEDQDHSTNRVSADGTIDF